MRTPTIWLLVAMISVLCTPRTVEAHPGRTASDGCHYCRTNCASWGEVAGARHCHGGYAAPTKSYSPPKPSCPANSYKVGDSCQCNTGYAVFQNRCYKVPNNAHAVNNDSSAWECDLGYKEVGGNCVKEAPPPPEPVKPEPPIEAVQEEPVPEPPVDESENYTAAPTSDAEENTVSSPQHASPTEPEEESVLSGLFGIGIVGGGGYYLYKRRKKKHAIS